RRSRWKVWLAILAVIVALAGGWFVWSKVGSGGPKLGHSILTEQVGSYKIEVFTKNPQLTVGDNPVRIEVKDAATGKPVDVGNVTLQMNMEMPGMQMQTDGVLQKSEQPGIYSGTIRPGMGGDWIARLGYDGPKGKEQKAVTLNVKP
ncbi:MAG: FixH family protein, partial [Verrucomicrobiota bacterium]|nr:FixH family protein [Verrucomicrobiota bacterium]